MPRRTSIRAAIAALVTGLATTGANVSTSRVNPHEVLPSLSVVSGIDEMLDVDYGHNVRRYEVGIEVRAGGASLDTQLELIDSEIYAVLENSNLTGLAMDTRWLSSSAPELSGEGDQPIGLMIIIYEVTYGIS